MSLVVGVIEDSQSVIDGISVILKASSNIKASHFARNKAEFHLMMRSSEIDIILLDLGLPDVDGQALIPEIRIYQPNAKIVVFTNFLSSRHVMECMQLGVDGYLLKHEVQDRIVEKIMSAVNGNPPLSYEVNRIILNKLHATFSNHSDAREMKLKAEQFDISDKELVVLSLIAQGLSVAVIASRINRTSHTVHLHLRSIYKKLNVHSRAAAVHVALSEGLIEKP